MDTQMGRSRGVHRVMPEPSSISMPMMTIKMLMAMSTPTLLPPLTVIMMSIIICGNRSSTKKRLRMETVKIIPHTPPLVRTALTKEVVSSLPRRLL